MATTAPRTVYGSSALQPRGGRRRDALQRTRGRAKSTAATTEVWFNLFPMQNGIAYAKTTVPFVPVDPDGVMSVVVHVTTTNTTPGASRSKASLLPAGRASVDFPTNLSITTLRQTQPRQQHPVLPGGKAPGSDRPASSNAVVPSGKITPANRRPFRIWPAWVSLTVKVGKLLRTTRSSGTILSPRSASSNV